MRTGLVHGSCSQLSKHRLEYGGAVLRWAADTAATAWKIAEKDSTWFSPSESSFMINYRVDDLNGLMENLRKAGVENFATIMDPEGNRIELWEPTHRLAAVHG